MAKGKKTGGRNFEAGQSGNPNGRPKLPSELKKARAEHGLNLERAIGKYLTLAPNLVQEASNSTSITMLDALVAKIITKAYENADIWRLKMILEYVGVNPLPSTPIDDECLDVLPSVSKRSFSEFCQVADYPVPFDKQVEMMAFGMDNEVPRLLLGSRGYGKTDYIVILGIAYSLYLNPSKTFLIMTKSKERNASIINEIQTALAKNGVLFDKANSNFFRIKGHLGKDHSVSAVTVKTVSLRGRHPDVIIMDDPVTEDDTSEATRSLIEKKYNELFKLCSNILIIGQPAHKFDLYAKLRGIIKTMEVPHGTIPELDHDLEAQRMAGVDEASIQASYFLKPPVDGVVPFDQLNYIDKYPLGAPSVAFIDPSHEGGDYTALTIVRQYLGGIAVVGFAYKKAWNHCLEEIYPQLQRFNVGRLAFETNGLGSQPLEVLGAVFKGVGIVGVRSNTNKHSRILMAGAFSKSLHLSRESNKAYTDQVIKYEYKAKHDDAPDSLASCLQWIGLIRGKE